MKHHLILKKLFYGLLGLLIIDLLMGCNRTECSPEEVVCPGFSNQVKSWISQREGDSITFMNDFGDKVSFIVESYTPEIPTISKCRQEGSSTCDCQLCSSSTGFWAESVDSIWVNDIETQVLRFTFVYNGYPPQFNNESIYCSYDILDHGGGVRFDEDFLNGTPNLDPGMAFHESITLGNITYENVISNERDTSTQSSSKMSILKSYMSLSKGVIGFYDLKTNSLFYLKN